MSRLSCSPAELWVGHCWPRSDAAFACACWPTAAWSSRGANSRIPELAAAGIEVSVETRYASAHNKILLIDAESTHPVIITGSYNFTFSAQARNAENLLILRDHPELARRYLANWRRHRAEAIPYAVAETP